MFRFIYLPLIIITLIYTAAYTAVYYLVFNYFGVSWVQEGPITTICAFLLSVIPIGVWIFPRVKQLKGPGDGSPRLELSGGIQGPPPLNDKARFVISAFACVIIGASAVSAIWVFQMLSLGLTPVSKVSDIYLHPKEKYFVIQHLPIDTSRSGIWYYKGISGRRQQYIYLNCDIVSPLETNNDAVTENTVWLGNYMLSDITNNITETEAQVKLKEYMQSSWNDWKKMCENKSFGYLERSDTNYLDNDLDSAIGVAGYHYKRPMILRPHFGSFKGEIKFRVCILLLVMIGGLLFWWLITSGLRMR
jgi:hypothetical protein